MPGVGGNCWEFVGEAAFAFVGSVSCEDRRRVCMHGYAMPPFGSFGVFCRNNRVLTHGG